MIETYFRDGKAIVNLPARWPRVDDLEVFCAGSYRAYILYNLLVVTQNPRVDGCGLVFLGLFDGSGMFRRL